MGRTGCGGWGLYFFSVCDFHSSPLKKDGRQRGTVLPHIFVLSPLGGAARGSQQVLTKQTWRAPRFQSRYLTVNLVGFQWVHRPSPGGVCQAPSVGWLPLVSSRTTRLTSPVAASLFSSATPSLGMTTWARSLVMREISWATHTKMKVLTRMLSEGFPGISTRIPLVSAASQMWYWQMNSWGRQRRVYNAVRSNCSTGLLSGGCRTSHKNRRFWRLSAHFISCFWPKNKTCLVLFPSLFLSPQKTACCRFLLPATLLFFFVYWFCLTSKEIFPNHAKNELYTERA